MNHNTLENQIKDLAAKLEGQADELNHLRREQRKHHSLRGKLKASLLTALILGSGLAVAVGNFAINSGVPATIPYEGYLEIGGVAVDGTRRMAFELLHCDSNDEDTCESPFWSSDTVDVAVSAGRFAVVLGDESLDADAYTLASHGLFVRISVDATGDGAELVQLGQLQQIHSVPFATNAADGIPPGTVITGDFDQCPAGYQDMSSDWEGRYVRISTSDIATTLEDTTSTTGLSFSDVGHSSSGGTTSGGGHEHTVSGFIYATAWKGGWADNCWTEGCLATVAYRSQGTSGGGSHSHNVSVSGTIAGGTLNSALNGDTETRPNSVILRACKKL
jgi:uncharacterized membrane protein YgcG